MATVVSPGTGVHREGKRRRRDAEGAEMDVNKMTEQIIGAVIAVHRALGSGLPESAYEELLCRELSLALSLSNARNFSRLNTRAPG
jgi:hypothetical protein